MEKGEGEKERRKMEKELRRWGKRRKGFCCWVWRRKKFARWVFMGGAKEREGEDIKQRILTESNIEMCPNAKHTDNTSTVQRTLLFVTTMRQLTRRLC